MTKRMPTKLNLHLCATKEASYLRLTRWTNAALSHPERSDCVSSLTEGTCLNKEKDISSFVPPLDEKNHIPNGVIP